MAHSKEHSKTSLAEYWGGGGGGGNGWRGECTVGQAPSRTMTMTVDFTQRVFEYPLEWCTYILK